MSSVHRQVSIYGSWWTWKKIAKIKNEIKTEIKNNHKDYPTYDFWDDFVVIVFNPRTEKEFADNAYVNLSKGYGYKILPVFNDNNKERLIQNLENTTEKVLEIVGDELVKKINTLSDSNNLPDLLHLFSQEDFQNLFQATLKEAISSPHDYEDELLFQHFLDFQTAIDQEGVEHHLVMYAPPGPSRKGLYFERLYVPIAVALSGTLGALVAAAEPLGAIAVGGVSGVTSLIINILSNKFFGEYHPDKEEILKLMSDKYNPIRVGVIWCLLRFQCPMSISEISNQLPYSESSIRYWIKELEKETIVITRNADETPIMYEMNKKHV